MVTCGLKSARESESWSFAHALWRATHSPVFRAMLFGPFSESKPALHDGRLWQVSLPEDDFAGLQVIFLICHGDFASVPDELSLDEL